MTTTLVVAIRAELVVLGTCVSAFVDSVCCLSNSKKKMTTKSTVNKAHARCSLLLERKVPEGQRNLPDGKTATLYHISNSGAVSIRLVAFTAPVR